MYDEVADLIDRSSLATVLTYISEYCAQRFEQGSHITDLDPHVEDWRHMVDVVHAAAVEANTRGLTS